MKVLIHKDQTKYYMAKYLNQQNSKLSNNKT